MSETRRIAIGIEYDGTLLSGSQSQINAPTVQDRLEAALSHVANEPVSTLFAGRTDSGVHATQQVVSFDTVAERDLIAWRDGTNANLTNDIAVVWAKDVPTSFHPRFSAQSRRYLYVYGECTVAPAIAPTYAWWLRERLDASVMDSAVQVLVGEHDFSSFRAANCQSKSAMRCVFEASVQKFGDCVVLDICANAFVLRMVRNIAGALVAVSRKEMSAKQLQRLLDLRDRKLAPPTAPAQGLYLVHVAYQEFPGLMPRLPPLLKSVDPARFAR